MALSNILVEPRREITETGVGILAFILFLLPPIIVQIFIPMHQGTPGDIPWVVGLLMWTALYIMGIILGLGLGSLLLFLIHAAGEGICTILAKVNIHLRPSQRYRRDYRNQIVKDGMDY
jgi:hypothetical protein